MDENKSDKDGVRGFADKTGKAARTAASKAVQGSKVVGDHVAGASQVVTEKTVEGVQAVQPHAAKAAGVAADQASRAAALTASQARRHMPKHEPGEPVRPAILDSGGQAVSILIKNPSDLPSFALLSSQFLLADFVTSREQDEKRWKKMERVLDRQRLALDEVGIGEKGAARILARFGGDMLDAEQIAFLVDLYFLDPFAPYALKSDKATRMAGLRHVAVLVSGDDEIVNRIDVTRRSALAAHTRRSLGKIGLIGLTAAVALGVAGFVAAPLVGAAIGGAAGLGGAAAVSHGLAILGGGALAAGGAGMAGGMWLVAGVGVAAGLLAAGGGTALYELGSATARGELVKLQITFKLGLLDANRDMAKAQQVISNLIEQADVTRTILEEERRLNDDNSQRVEDLEATLKDIEEAIGWMERERESVLKSA
jgi:hypothetical protein